MREWEKWGEAKKIHNTILLQTFRNFEKNQSFTVVTENKRSCDGQKCEAIESGRWKMYDVDLVRVVPNWSHFFVDDFVRSKGRDEHLAINWISFHYPSNSISTFLWSFFFFFDIQHVLWDFPWYYWNTA